MHKKFICLFSSWPQVQQPAINMALCLPVLLWTGTSSQTLLSTSEAKVAGLLNTWSRPCPGPCGKVYHPVNNGQFKDSIYLLQMLFHLVKLVGSRQCYYRSTMGEIKFC